MSDCQCIIGVGKPALETGFTHGVGNWFNICEWQLQIYKFTCHLTQSFLGFHLKVLSEIYEITYGIHYTKFILPTW